MKKHEHFSNNENVEKMEFLYSMDIYCTNYCMCQTFACGLKLMYNIVTYECGVKVYIRKPPKTETKPKPPDTKVDLGAVFVALDRPSCGDEV